MQVPVAHGKADIGIYREAGAQVISVLSNGVICERASVDEAYLDVTATAQQMLATAAAARHDNSMRQEHGQQQQQGQQGQLQQEEDETGQMERRSVAADGRADDEGGVSCGVVVPLPESVEGWHVAGMVRPAATNACAAPAIFFVWLLVSLLQTAAVVLLLLLQPGPRSGRCFSLVAASRQDPR
eukprot:GHUV01043953.1.p1 GENE.GHUV01043953.1~~GHUV01043953.1.p1  ORF type:complete len:184 (-),score=75.38 GHUV01043953.1:69-620(-)